MALKLLPAWNRHKVYKALGFFPVLFTLGLLFWSLAAYTRFVMPLMHKESRALAVLCGSVWFVLWLLTTWSYFICVFQNPGSPSGAAESAAHGPYSRIPSRVTATTHMPVTTGSSQPATRVQRRYADEQSFYSSEYGGGSDGSSSSSDDGSNNNNDADSVCSDDNAPLTQEQIQRAELVYSITVKDNGQPRFCLKCNTPKPDRTHHCSICGRCVLKMDHHCPWLNNCVGFHTQKAFLLFIVHGSLYCATTFITTAVYFLREFMNMAGDAEVNVSMLVLIILSGVFSLCLFAFSGFHIYLVLSNLTTIESYERNNYKIQNARRNARSKYINLFNIGAKKNFHQVFGSRWLLWPIPVHTTVGDGIRFPVNYEGYSELEQG